MSSLLASGVSRASECHLASFSTYRPTSKLIPSKHAALTAPPTLNLAVGHLFQTKELRTPDMPLFCVYAGSDVTVVGYGAQMQVLRKACTMAEEELGVSCELIDLRTLVPWDVGTVAEVFL